MPTEKEIGVRRLALTGALLFTLWLWLLSPTRTVYVVEPAMAAVPRIEDFPSAQRVEPIVSSPDGSLLEAPPVRSVDHRPPSLPIVKPRSRSLHLIQRDSLTSPAP